MYMSPFMRSLLEAPQDNNRNRNQNNPDEEDEQQQNAENQEDTQVEDNTEDQTDQDNQEENHDDNTEDNPDDNDPFNDDPEGGDNQDDLSNPPDGLESPDATEDGSEDMTDAGEEDEQNIQLNILPLSKLDRLTLKQKCYANFKDLRVKINRVISLVDDNEQLLEPEFRDEIVRELSELANAVSGYMTTKFSFNNYEENAKNYNIFAAQLDEIIKNIRKTTENAND